jgi:hypothetical protein
MTGDVAAYGGEPVRPKDKAQHAVVKLALGLLWRGGHGSRMVRRIAASLEWAAYCAEIDAVRASLRTEYAAAVERGEIEPVEPSPDLDAALLVALHYFHAKEAPPQPLPPAVLESSGDLLRYFVAEGIAGRFKLV